MVRGETRGNESEATRSGARDDEEEHPRRLGKPAGNNCSWGKILFADALQLTGNVAPVNHANGFTMSGFIYSR